MPLVFHLPCFPCPPPPPPPPTPHCRYVDKAFAKAGTELKVNVRGKLNDATVTKMPFVPTHYHKPAQ